MFSTISAISIKFVFARFIVMSIVLTVKDEKHKRFISSNLLFCGLRTDKVNMYLGSMETTELPRYT